MELDARGSCLVCSPHTLSLPLAQPHFSNLPLPSFDQSFIQIIHVFRELMLTRLLRGIFLSGR